MTYGADRTRRPASCRADLAVLLAVLTVVAGLSVAAVAAAHARAGRTRSADNLRKIGAGMQAHVSTFGFFPGNGGPPMEAVTTPDARTGFPDTEAFRWGYGDPKRAGRLQAGCWAYAILPHIGEEEAFRTQDHTRAVPIYYMGSRREALPQNVSRADPFYKKWTYYDAGLGPWGRTDYAANDQVVLGGMGNVMCPGEVRDGLAATALVAEKAMDSRAVRAGAGTGTSRSPSGAPAAPAGRATACCATPRRCWRRWPTSGARPTPPASTSSSATAA